MNAVAPLPLAPPPYRAEALHSWLRRVAAPYRMQPRQLLHALGVRPFLGPAISFPDLPIEAALEPSDLRYLARLARCDPSRLGLCARRKNPWVLACDDWMIVCPQCIRMDLQTGKPAYERAVWRIATGSFVSDIAPRLFEPPHFPKTSMPVIACYPRSTTSSRLFFRN